MNSSTKTGLAALGVVLLGLAFWWMGADEERRLAGQEQAGLVPEVDERAKAPAVEPDLVAPERVDVVDTSPSPEAPPATEQPSLHAMPLQGIYGRVTRRGGEAVPGCLVTAELSPFERWSCRSDVEGNYAIEFPLRDWAQSSPAVSAEAEQGQRRSRRPRARAEARRRLAELERGVRGTQELRVSARDPLGFEAERVIQPHAHMADRLRVNLSLANEPYFGGEVLGLEGREPFVDVLLFDRDWMLLQSTQTNENGRFSLRPPEVGSYRLHARKLEAGTAAQSGTYLALGSSPMEHSLVLGGDGLLRGQVELGDGEPVPGIELIGVAAPLAMKAMPRPTWPTTAQLTRFEEHRGLAHSRATTDHEGRFSMSAMGEGNYMLFFEGLGDELQPEGLYGTGPEHDVVFRARILRVHLSGIDDQEKLRVAVHFVERTPLGSRAGRKPRHLVKPGSSQGTQLVVEPNSTWGVFWESRGRFGREKQVTLDGPKHLEELLLVVDSSNSSSDADLGGLAPVEGRGRLDFVLKDEEGTRVEARVTLWMREDAGLRQLFSGLPNDAARRLPELRPGVYDYRIEPQANRLGWSLLAQPSGSVEVRAGGEREVTLKLTPAGKLRIALTESESKQESGEPPLYRAQLVAKGDSARSSWLTFVRGGEGSLSGASLAAGKFALCDRLIEAGEYELRVLQADVLQGSAEVKIEAGKLNEVRLSLEETP